MKKIALRGKNGIGRYALVDNEDYEALNKWKWYATYQGYAVRHSPMVRRVRGKQVSMHREIMNFPTLSIDHANMNKLDNRKSNLRLATKTQNSRNTGVRKDNKSGYKGVIWFGRDKKWRAYINVDKKFRHLGYYNNIKDAVSAYKKASREYFEEFGRSI